MEIIILPETVRLPQRRRDTHKGDYGRTLIIGGSVGYTGAPVLSAKAASRAGAGLVYVGVPKSIYEIAATKLDEEMPFPLPDTNGQIMANAAGEILHRAKQCDVCLIGPGLGRSDGITELVHSITRIVETPLVLDADALNAVAQNIDILNQAISPLVLTPHPGEFAVLNGSNVVINEDIAKNNDLHIMRLRASCEFAKKYNCILVLKGHRTIVALPNGDAYVNTTGGPAMAKAGSGDVLAGMIAAFIAQKFPIVDAVVNAVYLHGMAGDLCASISGDYSVVATDVINAIPDAMKSLIRE